MTLVSGKALWGIICGQSVLASMEVVQEELEHATKHLKHGLSYYKPFSEDEHKTWCQKSNIKKPKQDLVHKLGILLNLSSEQAWEIFQLFLQHEYKGSVSVLSSVLASDREELDLLHQVFSFYLSDQLHLLACRRHILFNHEQHPYKVLFGEYLGAVLDKESNLGEEIINQLHKLSTSKLENLSPLLPLRATHQLLVHKLVAIKHYLATLIIYYGTPARKCPPKAVASLFQLAQGGGLGYELLESIDRTDWMVYGKHIEAINAFHCILLTLIISPDEDPSNHLLCVEPHINQLDILVKGLGSKACFLPPQICWYIIQGKRTLTEFGAYTDEAQRYSKLAQRSLKPSLFHYLLSVLNDSSIKMDVILHAISVLVTQTVVTVVGSCFALKKLNLTQEVIGLGELCLASPLPADFFWDDEYGAATVILSPALELFPYNAQPLLRICTSLASASEKSCEKVIQLMNELPNLTIPVNSNETLIVGTSYMQCVLKNDIQFLPNIVIPSGTQGQIINDQQPGFPLVSWQLPINGWKVLLEAFRSLLHQLESGSSADDWLVQIVIDGLKLLGAVFTTLPRHISTLSHLHNIMKHLLFMTCKIVKSNYELICALFECASAVAKSTDKCILGELDGCSLLPTLPLTYLQKERNRNILMGYNAGTIRSLIFGKESASGKFTLLKSLCKLLESDILSGLKHSHVCGLLVFVVKEVLPEILQWSFCDPFEKVSVLECIFSLLHRALEEETVDEKIKHLIVHELIGPMSGPGKILRAVLEGSVFSDLDHPEQWPQSEYCTKCSKVSQYALSLTHRLVIRFLKMNSGNESTLTEIFGGSSNKHVFSGNEKRSTHIALTVAQFVYNRLTPRLTYLSLRILTVLAKEVNVPLVACLSTEAEGLKDCLLNRLGSASEDVWVKVAVVRLLITSCECQPGIIRLFLTPPESLLQNIVSLMAIYCKSFSEDDMTEDIGWNLSKKEASIELSSCLVELTCALWMNGFHVATDYLKKNPDFWKHLTHCIMECEPGSISDELIGNILKIISLEYYCEKEVCEHLQSFMKKFIDCKDGTLGKWSEYILVNNVNSMDDSKSKSQMSLLQSYSQFVVIVLKKAKTQLASSQIVYMGEKSIEGLVNVLETGDQSLDVIMAEIHLHFLHEFASDIVKSDVYKEALSHLFCFIKTAVMQIGGKCQLPIFAAALRVLLVADVSVANDVSKSLVSNALVLCEHHCCLVGLTQANYPSCSSPGVLALSCNLLHQCLLHISTDEFNALLEDSNIAYSLLQAATTHTQGGNVSVVNEALRLISLMVRTARTLPDLTLVNLSTSVSLSLSNQSEEIKHSILPDLLWCVINCYLREGPNSLNDVLSIVPIHLPLLVKSLENPHKKPKLALASAAVCLILSKEHSMWRIFHQQSFVQLLRATAACVHRTTKLLQLKETLEREGLGESDLKKNNAETNPSLIKLMNYLIKILGICLKTVLSVSPNLMDVLIGSIDVEACSDLLVQPSCRRMTVEDPLTLPNFASLADVLYIYNCFKPKDQKFQIMKGNSSGVQIDSTALAMCSENALYLLLSNALFALINENISARESREIKTFLADETASFFNHWLGKRLSSGSPQPSNKELVNLPYLKLCFHLVKSICQSSVS